MLSLIPRYISATPTRSSIIEISGINISILPAMPDISVRDIDSRCLKMTVETSPMKPHRNNNFPRSNILSGICTFSLHPLKYIRALQIVAAMLLPPFLPFAMMYGTSNSIIISFDSTTFTNPTGTPMIRSGLILPSLIIS